METRTKEYISGKHSGEQLAHTSPRVRKEEARESESKRATKRAEGDTRKGARYGKTNVGEGVESKRDERVESKSAVLCSPEQDRRRLAKNRSTLDRIMPAYSMY